MFCAKCGNTLADNAKFCPNCGNAVSTPNVEVGQQPVTMTAPVQQPVYASNPNTIQPKNNTMKIVGGIVIAILVIAVIALFNTVSEQEQQMTDYRNQRDQYEYQLYQYENRNAVDKTIDAIGSWLE